MVVLAVTFGYTICIIRQEVSDLENPQKQTDWIQAVKTALTCAQLGLTTIAPLILCMALTWWIRKQFSLGSWVTLIGLLVGLAAMTLTLIRYLLLYIRDSKKREEERKHQETGQDGQNSAGA